MKLLLLTLLLLGSQFHLVVSNDCFGTNSELKDAIAAYKQAGCNGLTDITEECETSNVVQTYGFPMNGWCFDSTLTSMRELFYEASAFNEDISSWDTSSVEDMYRMFWFATSFNGDLSNWDTSSVTSMYAMFFGATSFNQNLCAWSENYQAWYIDSNIDMFTDSGCTFQERPKREEGGPFCKSDCSPTVSPTTNPTASSSSVQHLIVCSTVVVLVSVAVQLM